MCEGFVSFNGTTLGNSDFNCVFNWFRMELKSLFSDILLWPAVIVFCKFVVRKITHFYTIFEMVLTPDPKGVNTRADFNLCFGQELEKLHQQVRYFTPLAPLAPRP